MSKQCLEISQMQHLKELGVDTRTASLCWVCLNLEPYLSFYDKEYPQEDTKVIPAFTLQDILDLLPKKLQHRYEDYELTLFYSRDSYDWKFQYLNENVSFMDYKSGEKLIDAAYEMLCWVIENGYLEVKQDEGI